MSKTQTPSTVEMVDSTQPVLDASPMNDENVDPGLLRPLNSTTKGNMPKSSFMAAGLMVFAVAAGIGTGFGLNRLTAKSSIGGLGGTQNIQAQPSGLIKAGDVFGSSDESTFKDSAEGFLQSGGVEGEGSHRLLRPGGDSQTVYLTSSVTDMEKFVGMEVKVWGETFKGQKAGWLMDVGRVQILNANGTAPTEE